MARRLTMLIGAPAAWSLAAAGGLTDTAPRALASPISGAACAVPTASPRTGSATAMSGNDRETARRFKETVLPYLDDAYNLARYLTRNAQDADDVVQEAYLRAFRFFATLKGSNARPWLLAIVRNCFYSGLKARSRGDTDSLSEIDIDAIDAATVVTDIWTAETIDPERTLIKLDDAARVRTAIESVPVPFREVLVLREMEELSYQEIAGIMGVPIGTVMSRLARARQLFKAAWLNRQEKGRCR